VAHAEELRDKGRAYDALHTKEKREREAKARLDHPEKHRERVMRKSDRRRARKAQAPVVEHVSLDAIYLRDKGICQLCFKRCRRSEATRDHVIPLSLGGAHSFQNIVLAHMSCNVRKQNKAIAQQQRLF